MHTLESIFKVSLGTSGFEHQTEKNVNWRSFNTEIIHLEYWKLNVEWRKTLNWETPNWGSTVGCISETSRLWNSYQKFLCFSGSTYDVQSGMCILYGLIYEIVFDGKLQSTDWFHSLMCFGINIELIFKKLCSILLSHQF